MTTRSDLLLTALSAAVPLRIWEIRDYTVEDRLWEACKAESAICSAGSEFVFFRGRKKGETARAFNWLVRGLAVGAYQPGGVTFAGQHWCTEHALCEAAKATDAKQPLAECPGLGKTEVSP